MKDILVLTRRPDDYERIADCLPLDSRARQAHDLETAVQKHTRTPFDMIVADIELLESEKDIGLLLFQKPLYRGRPLCPTHRAL